MVLPFSYRFSSRAPVSTATPIACYGIHPTKEPFNVKRWTDMLEAPLHPTPSMYVCAILPTVQRLLMGRLPQVTMYGQYLRIAADYDDGGPEFASELRLRLYNIINTLAAAPEAILFSRGHGIHTYLRIPPPAARRRRSTFINHDYLVASSQIPSF